MPTKYKAPRYYSKFRWIVEITNNPNHPDYPSYGARGIGAFWQRNEFKMFRDWLIAKLGDQPSPQHQLCRINKKGDFEPGNLQWMLPRQRSNTGTVQNVMLKYKRQSKSIRDWAEQLNIPYWTFRRRIAAGKTIPQILKEFK